MRIIPAILEKTDDQFINQLHTLIPYFTHFHIDIVDGQFVPNKTVQIEDLNNLQLRTFDLGLLTFDFHLMVDDPGQEVDKLNQLAAKKIKITIVFIHLKTFKDLKLVNFKSEFQLGIVLNPEDEVDANWAIIKSFPVIQIMSVRPGFQGAVFLPNTLKKIDALRDRGFGEKIYLDGGINDQTLPLIIKNQPLPDVLCIGSYLKQNPREKFKFMNDLIKTRLKQ